MPSKKRITYAGAWYHVYNRGVNKRDVFLNDLDCLKFLSLLDECVEKFNVEVHAYCLMKNHYHLLVHTPEDTVSDAMHWLKTAYSKNFNYHHSRKGPLFQSRFKSIPVQSDAYLLKLISYIHGNPVKDGFVESAQQYRWSSIHAYLGLKADLIHINTRFLALKNINAEFYCQFILNDIQHFALDELLRMIKRENKALSKRYPKTTQGRFGGSQ